MAHTHEGLGVRVAVDNATLRFDMLYDYGVPCALAQRAVRGARVVVPFGRGNTPRLGVILEVGDIGEATKDVLFIEDSPVLDDEAVELIFTLKDYTFCTYFDAVKAVLPKFSRVEPAKLDGAHFLSDVSKGYTETAFTANADFEGELTARQREVALAADGDTFDELRAKTGVTRTTVSKLVELGAVLKTERLKKLDNFSDYVPCAIPPLTNKQSLALDEIRKARTSFSSALLFGVTGSGKTLVYIKLIEECLSNGKSALVLVPEIAISTQMILRLKSLFGERVGIIHSALSDTERQLQWLAIRSKKCDVVVGTRSAVFAPLKDLGLIIVDEEQETAYCSEQSPRYSAVSIARYRATRNKAFLLFASATPSVETFCKAKNGKMALVRLDERYNARPLPQVKIVDMHAELAAGNSGSISRRLRDSIQERLERGEQTILLLNRRGYRTVTQCSDCRATLKCNYCDVPLVLHKQTGRMLCHYCGANFDIPEHCPTCGGTLRYTGLGTQRLEEEFAELFPSARVLRLDLDSTSRKNSAETYLREFGEGKYDILVGTQMIAKGLDFQNVTLVGVQSVDSMLAMASFRAYERTFAMLTQVIGRSGRGEIDSQAIIQTDSPDSPIMAFAKAQDYEGFYNDEILIRKANLYPPFCAVCTVGFTAEQQRDADVAAAGFVDLIVKQNTDGLPLRILGPVPYRVAFVNKMYRVKLTIKCRGDLAFRNLLRAACADFVKDKLYAKVRYSIDFNSDGDN